MKPLSEVYLEKCRSAATEALPEITEMFTSDARYAEHPWLLTLHASGTSQIVQGDISTPVHQPCVAVPIKPTDSADAIARALSAAWEADWDRMAAW